MSFKKTDKEGRTLEEFFGREDLQVRADLEEVRLSDRVDVHAWVAEDFLFFLGIRFRFGENNIFVDFFEFDQRLVEVVVVVEPKLATKESRLELRLVSVEQLAEGEQLTERELAVRFVVYGVEDVAIVV